jgi:hypothetical protein
MYAANWRLDTSNGLTGPVTSDAAALPAPDAGCDFSAVAFALYP